jgi:hypothetical protein
MNRLKLISLALVFFGVATANVAWASHHQTHFVSHSGAYHHPGWGHGHGYYWGFGFYGAAWPWFYPGYYGYVVPVLPDNLYSDTAAPVEYVQMNPAPTPANTPINTWYYCENPQGYYPYVKACAGSWKQVPAEPPK